MTPEAKFQLGLLEIPAALVPEEARRNAQDGFVLGLVTDIKTNLLTGRQTVRIDLETPAQAAEKFLREAEDGR